MYEPVLQRYEILMRLIRICAKICGADVFDFNYRRNILTYIVFTCIYLYFACTIYTVYVNLYIEGEWTQMLKTVVMISSGLQGYCKLLNSIDHREQWRYLSDELYDIYKEYRDQGSEYLACLHKSMDTVDKSKKFLALAYLMATGSLTVMVLIYRFAFHQNIFVLQFQMPYIDAKTEQGYLITNIIHFTCMAFGAFGNYAADLFFFMSVSHAPLFKDILKCKFHDLNDIIEGRNEENSKNYHILVKDIFLWHQKYMRFLTTIKQTFFWMIVVQMFTVAFSIVISMFCLILGSWPGGHSYLGYCFVTMYLYCGLGTVVEVAFSTE
ncbi:odorant receptor 67d-like isoform X2 [Musca autumnalis]|uniref:odorant receptor 67d-like isoform X2 n=1 Tax=Musca autumnalis TaxID=221902 RepID=UPI003CEDE6C3